MKPFLVQVPVDREKKLKHLILLNEINQENHSKEWCSMQGKKNLEKQNKFINTAMILPLLHLTKDPLIFAIRAPVSTTTPACSPAFTLCFPINTCVCALSSFMSNSLRPPWTVAHQAPPSRLLSILQARILELVATPSSRGSSRPRDQTHLFSLLH